MYAKISNDTVVKYPYDHRSIRHENPGTSFPSQFDNELLSSFDVYPVLVEDKPAYDPSTYKLVANTPVKVGRQWAQSWAVVAMTAEEQTAYAARQSEMEAAQERQQANEEYEPAKLAPALKVLAEKLLTADIAAETLPEKDAQAVTLLFPKWEGNGVAYPLGRVLQFNHHLYEVMQPHTSQPDWAPDVATTLFRRRYAPTGGIPEWQPWDNHNDSLHQIGSEVMHDGIHWISTVPNNHWVPGEYGWDQVN